MSSLRGALGFSVLRIWPMFGSVSRFSHLKTAVFRFGVLHGLRVFLNVVFGFRFSSARMAIFRFLCPVHLTVLPRKLHPPVALKPA